MRPLRLTMQAFGSFGKSTVIDFSELGENRLFLIHGPTGSGKTTILDAICFALYGSATGDERDAKGFRSDFAGPETTTEVTFDFSVGEREFRILRQPEQERVKLRGTGTTRSPVAATMWERTNAEDDEEGVVLATKWTDVTERVEEILGFRCDQFRQVIVLPQGRFRDLLMASSSVREGILQQLFDTSFYRKIQDSLKGQAKVLREDIKSQTERRKTYLETCDCEDETELAELIGDLEKDLEKQTKIARKAGIDAKKAQEVLTKADTLEARFVKLEKAMERLEEMEAQADDVDAQRETLASAQKAGALGDLHRTVKDARKERNDAALAVKDAKASLTKLQEQQAQAKDALKAEKDKQAERKALEKKATDLERVRPLVAALTNEQAKRDDLKEKLAQQSEALELGRKALESARKNVSGTESEIKRIQGKVRDPELLARVLKDAEEAKKTGARVATTAEELSQIAKALKTASAAATKAEQEANQRRERLRALESQRLEASAAMLAKELREGEPCAVCGSTNHPSPATSDSEIPGDDAIEGARLALSEAEKHAKAASKQANEVEKSQAKLETKLSELTKGAAKQALTLDDLDAAVTKAREALEANKKLAKGLAEQTKLLEKHGKAVTEAEKAFKAAEKAYASIDKKLGEAEVTVKERQKSIGGDFESEEAVAVEAEIVAQALQQITEALERATEAERDASAKVVEASTEWKNAEKAQKKANAKAERAEGDWADRLAESGFSSEEVFVDAQVAEKQQRQLADKIKAFDDALKEAKVRAHDLSEELKNKQRPEIEKLQATATELEALRTSAEGAVTSGQGKINSLAGTQSTLATLKKELEKLELRYGVLGKLSDTADGQNSLRVSFQRFVLATRLDDVLVAASERLLLMTKGRYRIQRNTRSDDKRAAGGLELEVDDAYTGTCRAVSTLSGGESFQAALALALGLSEIVQAYSGGIRLDTIFVDEGFGSLDPEALELAINTLMDLQASGRMVGVISHVPELKERIDVRLTVGTGKTGSTAAFRLP